MILFEILNKVNVYQESKYFLSPYLTFLSIEPNLIMRKPSIERRENKCSTDK